MRTWLREIASEAQEGGKKYNEVTQFYRQVLFRLI